MDKTFRDIINAAAYASSNFVQKIYEDNEEGLAQGLQGVKFETTVTILDENDMPVMVARATTEKQPEIQEEITAEEIEATKEQEQTPEIPQQYPNMYGYYPPMQYYMPGMPQMPMQQPMAQPQMTQPAPVQEKPVVQPAPAVKAPEVKPEPQVEAPKVQTPQPEIKQEAKEFVPVIKENPAPAAEAQEPGSADDKKSKIEMLLKKYSNV